ncbi:MAG TPA: hypothetical protein VFY18_08530 [Candidatus Limnocylindrales bacterium]|nr:hypothetical protein [Candidatus Limnocylindrales bacterium]
MYWQPWRWPADGWLGAWIGAVLAGALAAAGRWLGAPTVVVVGLVGVPVGALVGGRYGPAIAAGGSRIQFGLRAGLVACLVAAGAWLAFTMVASLFQPADAVPNRLIYLLYVALVIPGSVGIVGLPFALPIGVLGAVAIREVRRRGRLGVAALGAATVVLLVTAAVAFAGGS